MLTVRNDWIEYEDAELTAAVPARRVAVRGGAACAQRLPVMTGGVVTPDARPGLRRAQPERPRLAPARHDAVRAPRAAAPRPRLRLTRRGRVVLVVLPALLLLSGALLAAAPGVAEAAQPVATATSASTVVVGTGDTLWSIAERVAPRSDPREVVAALERANHLEGSAVQAGQVLALPGRG